LTMKCEAAANPMTRLLNAMGKTSAPVRDPLALISHYPEERYSTYHTAMLCYSTCHLFKQPMLEPDLFSCIDRGQGKTKNSQ
jgi:hypothetical protein